ncbi:hypothetical protein VF14_18510 [Nostoc linckia z18]|uniref:Uncharacterized protein n=1 Tax=Nostoc linckia z7 TaxID=1628745 RepID=A0ABX4KBC1_NOSLI|nr:hypothetical protein VF04_36585 [Nostoc linckia z7]PHK09349.1 hypothetical protein VF09_16165 [Nostoc linckia z9]PHK33106.1 hypothetical protein VF14_18510 [Nostoc linckia z18]
MPGGQVAGQAPPVRQIAFQLLPFTGSERAFRDHQFADGAGEEIAAAVAADVNGCCIGVAAVAGCLEREVFPLRRAVHPLPRRCSRVVHRADMNQWRISGQRAAANAGIGIAVQPPAADGEITRAVDGDAFLQHQARAPAAAAAVDPQISLRGGDG